MARSPFFIISLFFSLVVCSIDAKTIDPTITRLSDQTKKIELHFKLEPNDFIYSDYIQLSVNHPNVTLSEWHSDTEPAAYYDPTFRDTKKIFNNDFTLITYASYNELNEQNDNVILRVNYYPHKKGVFCETLIPLTLHDKKDESEIVIEMSNQEKSAFYLSKSSSGKLPIKSKKIVTKISSIPWRTYLTNLVKTTEQMWLRILLIFLLGFLLSLTPCVYPMIPITIGILQAQAHKSVVRNFFNALFYTLGLSTTFAILGLLAAFAGQRIGSLMVNPLIIFPLVIMLIYVSLSLFGLYELYIPRFLKNKKEIHTGTLISVFIFGMISGTVASPCVFPGLIFVLTIVSNLQDLFLGFILLFVFGFGLSFPLLVIGTFSAVLTFLPQAGEWMAEVKHLLGFILFGVCFYFLNYILPWYMLLWLIALFVFITGVFYLYTAQQNKELLWTIKIMVGTILISSSVYFVVKGFQVVFLKAEYAVVSSKKK